MDLALNNLQRLICHKTKPNQNKTKQNQNDDRKGNLQILGNIGSGHHQTSGDVRKN